MLIAEPLDFSPRAVARLETVADVVLEATAGDALAQAFQAFDVVWIRLASRITPGVLGVRPRCRLLVVATTGLDHIDLEACAARNVRVISLRGEVDFLRQIRATAEWTLCLTLALLRRLPEAVAATTAGRWERDAFRGHEVHGKTVGIVGVGRLGTIVAGYFRALGAKVVGYDPRPDFPHDAAERIDDLEDLMSQSDIVCVMARYDSTTHHLINRRALAACRPGAVLINTARGGIVDEAALLEALEAGSPAGAALDVLDGEPHITADHPVVRYAQTHANVLLSPHLGGNTFESFEKTETFLADKVIAALSEAKA